MVRQSVAVSFLIGMTLELFEYGGRGRNVSVIETQKSCGNPVD